MAYGKVPPTGGGKIIPICQPGQDIEACRRDLLEKPGGQGPFLPVLFFVAALAIIGGSFWFVLSGRWTLMLIELEQRIRSLRR